MHSITGRIPKEIRDLEDPIEIELDKKNIINTLSKKIKIKIKLKTMKNM